MNPFGIVKWWIQNAVDANIPKATAFCLSTVDQYYRPSSRMLLTARVVDDGIIFCTDSRSPKVKSLQTNSNASALFYWNLLSRQLRLEGNITPFDQSFAEDDYAKKTFEQQQLITLCTQSAPVNDRRNLEQVLLKQTETENRSCPEHWKSYKLTVYQFECFVGGQNRLNKRLRFNKISENRWRAARLEP